MDDGAAALLGIFLFLFFLVMEYITSAYLSALTSCSQKDADELPDNKQGRRIRFFMDRPHAVLRVRQTILCICNMLAGLLIIGPVSHVFFPILEEGRKWQEIIVVAIVILVLLLFTLWIGAFLPHLVGEHKGIQYAYKYTGIFTLLYYLTKPMSAAARVLSGWVGRLDGIDAKDTREDVTEEEIISMVNEGHEQGTIQESQAEMIHNIFELDDTEAGDIMTVRKSIVALDCEMRFGDAFSFMLQEHYSRFPVYQEDLDHITGIVHIKDAMQCEQKESYKDQKIKDVPGLVRDAIFIPETQSINTLFRTMQSQKSHMVIVVDEYGQTSGIVSMEDILEEIVGNIEDEHDDEEAMIVKRGDHSFLLNGMADLEDVEDALGITIDVDDVETLNGLLVTLIDKIPEDNERFDVLYKGYLFRVLSVKNKTIRSVLAIRRKNADEQAHGNTDGQVNGRTQAGRDTNEGHAVTGKENNKANKGEE